MAREFLRIFKEYDIEDVRDHLLILGDLSSDCGKCRCMGIDFNQHESCPECGTPYRYVTSRRLELHPGESARIVRRALDRRPHWTFVDYTDYQKLLGQKKARDFFA